MKTMDQHRLNMKTASANFFLMLSILVFFSCGGDDVDKDPVPTPSDSKTVTITIDPASVKQGMIGFGGALTWYSNWMTSSSKKNEIADLIFTDLGIDIIRFKNWYYPDGYPSITSTETMTDDNSKALWNTTNELHELALARNPNIRTLLSSWGPPQALKSNNNTRSGTLKKSGSAFMYDEYADYWQAVLDHVPFDPDYISIQNEPTFVNTGWTTCQWAAAESASLPDYHIAFDKVYNKIKDRPHVPVMIGPESQDVPTFTAFANVLKDKAHCGVFAYHPYNINSGTPAAEVISSLQRIGAFSTKPNIMTEFSDNLDWYNTALFIQRSLVYANSSGYIYWKLVWSKPASGTDAGMVSLTEAGNYTVTPFYYLMKHFSKNIDAGYHRVESTSPNTSLFTSAFMSPDEKKMTVIVINNGSSAVDVDFSPTGKIITRISADQSKEGDYYKPVIITSPTEPVSLPAKTITTLVLDI
jgi:glucuronoarabinoxylan endo-1,4-beta-xylanase